MESHILNSYHHQARYGLHNVNRIASSDCSSDSGPINSPEYQQRFTEYSKNALYNKGENWKDSGQEDVNNGASSDSEDELQDENSSNSESEMVEVDDAVPHWRQGDENGYYAQENMHLGGEEYEMSGNSHYLEVYAIDPNARMSSDEEDDFSIKREQSDSESDTETTPESNDANFFESQIVSNIDEYFVKVEEKCVDNHGHVVNDVDEYFTKPANGHVVSNVDEYFIKDVSVEKVPEKVEKPIEAIRLKRKSKSIEDPNILPHIENIKRFLLDGLPETKPNKLVQRSCSLPHSPAHFPRLDSDMKSHLSLEGLNISELSDFSFEKDCDKNSFLDSPVKAEEPPCLLTDDDVNGFFVNPKKEKEAEQTLDDFNHEDMEIESPVETKIEYPSPVKTEQKIPSKRSSKILDFCIEKPQKFLLPDIIKSEVDDDDIDVEGFTDNTTLPVLAANNLNSLLEQFEASETLNKNVKKEKKVEEKVHNGLSNGVRLHDAAVQLNKAKLKHMMMTSSTPKASTKSESVHSDHDYCSPEKRRPSIRVKAGQSLLKPEVLSSNNKILNSRHRSCKNKKIIYDISSDEEIDVTKKTKPTVKTNIKAELHSNHRKKASPINSVSNFSPKDKSSNSVISTCALKASDNDSQCSSGSIKLTIKNKSKVILKLDCDDKKDSHSIVHNNKIKNITKKEEKQLKENSHDVNKSKVVIKNDIVNAIKIKEEPRPIKEDFYMNLFNNKQDVQVPKSISPNKPLFDVVIKQENNENKQRQKKKLNLQEYKLRKEGSSNGKVLSPEAIFSDLNKIATHMKPELINPNLEEKVNIESSQNLFDPIREASRKVLMNTQKQLARRQRMEDIVMTKIPKVENLELQPLISDADMLKMVGNGVISKESLPVIAVPVEKAKPSAYEERIMVSIGTNTDEKVFKSLRKEMYKQRIETRESPPNSNAINFKIKSSEKVSKQNVFDGNKDKHSPKETKMDKERFKDITATIKSVGKKVDKRISSNSLFASIQDVVMKKALDDEPQEKRKSRSYSPVERRQNDRNKIRKKVNTVIVRAYDTNIDHGEDKVILHLEKKREQPKRRNIVIQTDGSSDFEELNHNEIFVERSKNDSESSGVSKSNGKSESKRDSGVRSKRRRSRSRSYRSPKRYRSRSPSRYHYRRSNSPYRRSRKSISPYRKRGRKSPIRDRSRSKKRNSSDKFEDKIRENVARSISPSRTPPLRKATLSESSDSSSSSYSSSSSSSSSSSRSSASSSSFSSERSRSTKRKRSYTPEYKQRSAGKKALYDDFNDTPVEERRIVFVGKLEKDLTKAELRSMFIKFGPVIEATVHCKEDGNRYGFVTFQKARDAFNAVGAASCFPQYDVGFGGRRAFCRQRYADLDGMEAKYVESAYHGPPMGAPSIHNDNMPFEQMLMEIKKKLHKKRKYEQNFDV